MITEPMLAAQLLSPDTEHTDDNIMRALETLKYPVLVSKKEDGIRALRMEEIYLASRRFKWIPNSLLCGLATKLPVGFDMELCNPELDYNTVQSIVMSQEHEDTHKIEFHVLDTFAEKDVTYVNRCHWLDHMCKVLQFSGVGYVKWNFPRQCNSPEELFFQFIKTESENGEGICFRLPGSLYKQGRSTLSEQSLVKLCRYVRKEVTVIGFKEQYENTNGVKRNDIGKMDRSKSLKGMVGKGTLGAFRVSDVRGEYDVGTGIGMTDEFRKEVWNNKKKWLYKVIIIKSKAHGVKIKPRNPVYIGVRDERD